MIGDRIRARRTSLGLSQAELARLTKHMSSQAINLIESGQTRAPTPENLFFLADALGVNARELVFGSHERTISTAHALADLIEHLPQADRRAALSYALYTAEHSTNRLNEPQPPEYQRVIEKLRDEINADN